MKYEKVVNTKQGEDVNEMLIWEDSFSSFKIISKVRKKDGKVLLWTRSQFADGRPDSSVMAGKWITKEKYEEMVSYMISEMGEPNRRLNKEQILKESNITDIGG